MLTNNKPRFRSEKGNRYGFITDWNVVILDSKGSTMRDNVPGNDTRSDIAFGDLDRSGSKLSDVFDESELGDFNRVKSATDKASALGILFGACAQVPGGFVVGNDTGAVMTFVKEWTSRPSRLVPAEVPGIDVRLTAGSRELLAMIAFEGHPHMDYAIFCEAVVTGAWGSKFDIPDDYLYEGHVTLMRSYADGNAPAIKEFLGSYGEDIRTSYDCPVARELIRRFV